MANATCPLCGASGHPRWRDYWTKNNQGGPTRFLVCPECATTPTPKVVVLCGSTRFKDAFVDAGLYETLAGNIVLSIGCAFKSDTELGIVDDDPTKRGLDRLHMRKIELADEVLVLNVDGYIGTSTAREIAHAQALGKPIRYLEPIQEVPPDGH